MRTIKPGRWLIANDAQLLAHCDLPEAGFSNTLGYVFNQVERTYGRRFKILVISPLTTPNPGGFIRGNQ